MRPEYTQVKGMVSDMLPWSVPEQLFPSSRQHKYVGLIGLSHLILPL